MLAGFATTLLAALIGLTMKPGKRYNESLRWDLLRALIRKRDGYQCRVCDARGVYGRVWLEVHHKRRVAGGGSHYPWNLALLCKHCHDLLHGGA